MLFSLLVLTIFSLSSCQFLGPSIKGNGQVTEETRLITGYERIKASNGLEVSLIPDSTEYVVVEADENLHEYIRTEMKDKTIEIFVEGQIRWASARKVLVHYRQLNGLQSSSGATIRNEESLRSKYMELAASSGSQQYLSLDTESLDSQCSSGAQIHVSGKCANAEIKASSGAHFKGNAFSARDCIADVSSGAHISVEVQHSITAEASSGGHVNYSGSPEQTNVHSSSGGVIAKK